jgi:protein-S-isoprenylcysteine O-methyltransferase Ste14
LDVLGHCRRRLGHWAIGAALATRRSAVKQRSDPDLASRLGATAGLAVALTPGSLWDSLTIGSPWLRLVGVAVLVPGAGAAVWARVALGTLWSSAVTAREEHQLRTEGPYGITRHPIYTGILAMLTGTALTQGLGRWIALLAAVAVVLIVKLRAEERLLERQFPGQYARYRQRVPALIPRVLPRGR